MANSSWPLRGPNSFKARAYIYVSLIGSAGQISFGRSRSSVVWWFFAVVIILGSSFFVGKKLIHISSNLDFLLNLLGRAEAALLLEPQLIGTFFSTQSFYWSSLGKSPLAFWSIDSKLFFVFRANLLWHSSPLGDTILVSV